MCVCVCVCVCVVLLFIRDDNDDAKSDMSSTSQYSYDPLHPNFQDRDGEIGSTASTNTKDEEPSTVVLITQRLRPDPGMNECMSEYFIYKHRCTHTPV